MHNDQNLYSDIIQKYNKTSILVAVASFSLEQETILPVLQLQPPHRYDVLSHFMIILSHYPSPPPR